MAVQVLDSTAISTTPTNVINPNGAVVAMTFKGMSAGLSRGTASNVSFTVSYPGFDSTGAATTVTETVKLNGWLRMPFPKAAALSDVLAVGTIRSNRVTSKGNMYRVTASTGVGITVLPTATGTAGVSTTTPEAGQTYLYLGNPTDNTSATEDAYSTLIENTSGSDVIIYGVLSEPIPSGATITAVSCPANTYGSSLSSSGVTVSFTHSQTLTAPKPYLAQLTMPRQMVTSTIRLETAVWAWGARSRRTAACHKFLIYNSSGTLVDTVTLTSMTTSTIATGGNTVQVFGTTYDASALSDGDYYIKEECYPWKGGSFKTNDDGYGSSTLATTSALTANVGKWIPFTKKASPTYQYAYVDGTGAAPAVSTVAATARTTPYADIVAAATALQTANGGSLDSQCIIRIMDKGSDYTGAINGNLQLRTYGKTPVVIEIDPLATPGSVNIATGSAVANASKQGPTRAIFRGLKFTSTATTSAMYNAAAASIGDFSTEQWFENCNMVATSSQAPITNPGLMWFVNCTFTNIGASFGNANTRTAMKLAAGCQLLSGGSATASISPIASLGCVFSNNSTATSPSLGLVDARMWGEGVGSQTSNEFCMYMFNSWPQIRKSGGISVFNGTNATAKEHLTRGGVFVMNLMEVADADSNASADAKGGAYSGDAVTQALPELHFAWNTILGDGANIAYNDTGTAAVEKRLYGGFNWLEDVNHKGDYYDANTAHEARVGNLMVRYKCGFNYNFHPGRGGSFNRNPSPANNLGDAFGPNDLYPTSATPLDSTFVSDKSWLSSGVKTGNGDYHPTGSNGAIGMSSSSTQAFPLALDGAAWAASDAVGCYAKV